MTAAATLAALLATLAAAPGRPTEDDLFGAPPSQPAPQPPRSEPPRAPEAEPGADDRLAARLAETREALAIGGQLYLRAFGFSRKGTPPSRWDVTAPSLLDLYLDARPNDRLRAFALARTQYDPTAADAEDAQELLLAGAADAGQPLPIPGVRARRTTEVLLDQLWLRFDAGRRAFFTVGKQHVKWGVGRFWNPTDFLHAVRRDPLATFDARAGTTMARLHVPWEARGWNLYAAAVLEPLVPARERDAPRADQLGALGGALRGEVVLGTAEIGVGTVVQKGRPARLGIDASAGVWDLDVYGELALRSSPEVQVWREVRDADPSLPVTARFRAVEPGGPSPSATLGASWSWKYGDDDTLTLGAEYFYNRNGYSSARIYPWLLLQGDFTPFYVGRHYAGVFAFLPGPGRWNDASFTASVLGNASDGTFVTRLDVALVVLTHLRLEAFTAAHLGSVGGEFRFGVDVPPQDLGGGVVTPRIVVGAPLVDIGVALRVSL